ncbi:MAG: CHAT domain-containing protein [Waterburya sp.]
MFFKTKNSLFFSFVLIIASISIQPALSEVENAQQYRNRGIWYWQKGNLNEAIAHFQKEASIHHAQKHSSKEIEAVLRISHGYIKLGKFRLAIIELNRAKAIPSSNNHLKALIQTRIGSAESEQGKYQRAVLSYKHSLKQEKSVSTLNNLVQVLQKLKHSNLSKAKATYSSNEAQEYNKQAKDYESQALRYAEEAINMSLDEISLSSVRSLIEWNNLTARKLDHKQLARGRAILAKLPPSRSLVFSMLNWASIDVEQTDLWLKEAKHQAQILGDRSLKSYVYLELGHFYNRTEKLNQAQESTYIAQSLSQSKLPNETLYLSQRLAGQIADRMGNSPGAIKNYQNAITSIDLIARNVDPTSPEQIRQFNQKIQPIYREALELILNKPNIQPTDLKLALVIADKLRLSELRGYFGDNCFEIQPRPTRNSHQKKNNLTASINSIILKDKAVFILELPNGKLVKKETKIKRSQLINQAQQWYEQLLTGYTWEFLTGSGFFYDLIIKPFETELRQENPKILVFIHDGILRNLPMAALKNEKGFLIEKWAIISSLNIKATSQSVKEKEPKALVFGLSQPKQQGWSNLDMIPTEVNQVNQSIDGKKFLNQNFTVSNLRKQLLEDNYSVVHLATHGYFGGSAENSFILAYDRKISVLQLEDILTVARGNPDLLVLSACETAINSDLSFLGLAGVAAKSGVNSTLSSLWQVDDQSQSEFMRDFYSDFPSHPTLKSSQSYALALQKIQIEKISQLEHPNVWAALTLISN